MFIAEVSNDGKYLLIYTTRDTDDVQLLSVADISEGIPKYSEAKLEFKDLLPDWIGGFQYIHNIDYNFYFKTNYKAPLSRVIMIDVRIPKEENWVEMIPE